MPDLNINTQAAGYQSVLASLETMRAALPERLRLFKKVPLNIKRLWLQRDPALLEVFKMALKVSRYIERLKDDLND